MAAALQRGRTELEQANSELEAFSYSVSHDLRAPLRAINGFAQMIEEDYATVLAGEGNRYLAVIRKEATRLALLIDDLLSFSRLGRKALVTTVVDLEALAREAFREVTHEDARARLVIDTPIPHCAADRALVRQVLINLISNAVKFSEAREEVVVELGAREGETLHEYWIGDRGVGFDMRYVDKLFGVFQRLHSDEEFRGTGVGLAIVRRVVRRHGGEVHAQSVLGEGATFTFTLPAAEAANEKETTG
jgi:light-regulated signal transduction histidine kinase (bacteriophytochrome)